MNFTQTQITEILDQIANGKNGYQELLKLSLESIMRSERQEFNKDQSDESTEFMHQYVKTNTKKALKISELFKYL